MTDVSITDIAKAAGVAPSTVSRALAGHARISAKRRAEIQSLARDMGYRPCQVARSSRYGPHPHSRRCGNRCHRSIRR